MAFPLNIGFEACLGSVELYDAQAGWGAELGVARAEVLVDVWRRRRLGSYAQFGLGPAYELWLHTPGALPSESPPGAGEARPEVDRRQNAELSHVVAPFTRASFAFHHETGDGHHVIGARLGGGVALTTASGGSARFRASASYEAILLGLNDLPLSAFVRARYRFEQAPRPTAGRHDLAATAGVRLGVPLVR